MYCTFNLIGLGTRCVPSTVMCLFGNCALRRPEPPFACVCVPRVASAGFGPTRCARPNIGDGGTLDSVGRLGGNTTKDMDIGCLAKEFTHRVDRSRLGCAADMPATNSEASLLIFMLCLLIVLWHFERIDALMSLEQEIAELEGEREDLSGAQRSGRPAHPEDSAWTICGACDVSFKQSVDERRATGRWGRASCSK